MVLADTTKVSAHADTPTDRETGSLVLRVHGRGRDGDIVRLESTKCTIGSDRRCTLRLLSRGIQPIHCLIVRGRQNTLVRRWSPDTRLNGKAFSDAPLTSGDRLSIGPIELEVVQATAPTPLTQVSQAAATQNFPDADRLATRLALANRQGHRRVRSLIDQLRRERREKEDRREQESAQQETLAAELQQRAAQLDADRQSLDQQRRELESQHAELVQKGQQLDDQRRAWEAETAEALAERQQWQSQQQHQQEELDKRSSDLETREAQLQAQRNDLDQQREAIETQQADIQRQRGDLEHQREEVESSEIEVLRQEAQQQWAQWEAESHDHEQQLARHKEQYDALRSEFDQQQGVSQTQAADMESQRAELEALRSQFEQQRRHWAAECEARQEELQRQQRDLDLREARLENAQRDFDARECQLNDATEQLALERQRFETDQAEAAPATPVVGSPADALATLQRLGLAPAPSDEEPLPPSAEADRSQGEPSGESSALQTEANHDESIDEYMVHLMQRVRTGAASRSPSTLPPVVTPSRAAAPSRPQPAPAKPKTGPEPPAEPTPRAPRRPAVVNPEQFSAMRELASASAQSAIDVHAKHKYRAALRAKLIFALVALVSGTALIGTWATVGTTAMSYYVGLVALVAAGVWGVHYVILALQTTDHRSEKRQEPPIASAEPRADKPSVDNEVLGESHSEPGSLHDVRKTNGPL